MAEKKTKKKTKKIKQIELLETELQMYEQMPEQIKQLKGWSQKELEERIEELRQKIEQSKRGKSSKIKGATYENKIAKKFQEVWGIRLVRTPLSGGFQKSSDNEEIRGDLSCIDKGIKFLLHPECKYQRAWKLREWFNQAQEDCPSGKIPIVIFHKHQKIESGKLVDTADDFVQIRLDDFLKIVDKSKVIIKEEQKGATRDEGKRSKKSVKRIIPRRKNV